MSRASPLGGEVYPHLVGILTEKVSLNVGLYEIFFCLVADAPHLLFVLNSSIYIFISFPVIYQTLFVHYCLFFCFCGGGGGKIKKKKMWCRPCHWFRRHLDE